MLGAGRDMHVVPTEPGCWEQYYRLLHEHLTGQRDEPPVALADAMSVLRIQEAAMASARAGSPVPMAS
jgi:predicted dehydrogenase